MSSSTGTVITAPHVFEGESAECGGEEAFSSPLRLAEVDPQSESAPTSFESPSTGEIDILMPFTFERLEC